MLTGNNQRPIVNLSTGAQGAPPNTPAGKMMETGKTQAQYDEQYQRLTSVIRAISFDARSMFKTPLTVDIFEACDRAVMDINNSKPASFDALIKRNAGFQMPSALDHAYDSLMVVVCNLARYLAHTPQEPDRFFGGPDRYFENVRWLVSFGQAKDEEVLTKRRAAWDKMRKDFKAR